MSSMKIHFIVSPQDYAKEFGKLCIEKWGQTSILQASYVVSIGGDGTALLAQQETLSAYLLTGKMLPVYNIDRSNFKYHLGALTNKNIKNPKEIEKNIIEAKRMEVFPLRADCELQNQGEDTLQTYYGLNEITIKALGYEITYLDVKFNNEDSQVIKGDGFTLATYIGRKGYYYNLHGRDFKKGFLGFQTIASRQVINRIIPDNSTVDVKVISHHRPTAVMRDCNLISEPISTAVIKKSKIPLIVLKDRQREN